MSRGRRPIGCSQEVYDAIDVFTDDELEPLFAEVSSETGEFLGIGFEGPGGMVCTFAEPEKVAAIAVLDEQYRRELDEQYKVITAALDMRYMKERQQGVGKYPGLERLLCSS